MDVEVKRDDEGKRMLKQKELLEKYCGQFNSTLSLILNADYGFRFVKHRVQVDNTKRMLQ